METLINEIKSNPLEVIKNIEKNKFKKLLEYLSNEYYNKNNSLVSDQLFDYLKEEYEKKYEEMKIGAPVKDRDKTKLPYYLGSLNKLKTEKEINKWLETYNNGSFIISNKLDGLSGLLCKKNGKLYLYTRGDGVNGMNRSNHIKNINIKEELKEGDAIRGELIISKKNFEKIKHLYSNPRCASSGIINSDDNEFTHLVDFVPYIIMSSNETLNLQLKKFKKPVKYIETDKIDIKELSQILTTEREKYKYEIDGLVIFDCSRNYPLIENENPKYGFSFKQIITENIMETTVIDVIWELSRYKYIKPTIKIIPVEILGTIVTQATAHNAKFIVDNNIGIGSVVEIIKSGEVIPYIYKVLKPSDLNSPKMPDMDYEWNSTGIDIIGKNLNIENKNTVLKNKLIYTFEKLKISFLGEGNIKKLIDNGFNDFWKIIYAKEEDLLSIEGFGHTSIEKLINSIQKGIKNAKMEQILTASQCFDRGIGEKKFKLLLEHYPNFIELHKKNKITIELISNIKGFQYITSNKIIEGMDDFIKWYDCFLKYKNKYNLNTIEQVSSNNEKKEIKSNDFLNKKICFSGFRDLDLEKQLENLGAILTTSVSSKTDFLIVKNLEQETSKSKKAIELNIKILTENDLLEKLSNI